MKKLRSLLLLAVLLLLVLCGCTEEKPSVQTTETPSLSEPVTETRSPAFQEAPRLPETPEIPDAPEPLQQEDAEEEPVISYILNTNTRKFHKPTCHSALEISPKNYQESTQTRDEIISDGYKPCKNCNP